jgi:CHRD domain
MVAARRLLATLFLAAIVAAVATAPAGAQTATKCAAVAVLKPGNEVRAPDTTDPVDSRATGAAAVHINGTRLTFTVAIFNPFRETFERGHIHIGARGVNGGVLVTLFGGSNNRRLFTQFEQLTISQQAADAICGDLAGHYINYHTTQDPDGAVRGQLIGL